MSTIAKIFVVINLVLAVVFATFTVALFSKRVSYYDLKVKTEVELKQKVAALEDAKKKVETERDDFKGKMTAAETKRDEYKAEATTAAKEKADALVQKEAADSRSKVALESQQVLIEASNKMREELEKGRKIVVALKERETVLRGNEGELKKERDDLKNQLNLARRDLQDLHRDRRRIAEELANSEYVIKRLIDSGVDVYEKAGGAALGTVPDVRTKVVDVRPATGHVAIGAGRDSGIREGFIFLIHRGDQYIGKIRVTTVWNNFSGGTIVERKKPMQAGDDAMSDTNPTP